MQELNFEHHPIFIFACLLLGIAYAFIQYNKKSPWSKSLNYILAALRAVLVTIIAVLLVSPIIKLILNEIEKPTYVIAVDNSKSISLVRDSLAIDKLLIDVNNYKEKLEEKGFIVELRSLSEVDDLSFTNESTNLAEILTVIQSDYEGRNLSGVLLVSDGIYNQGISPAYKEFSFPINTWGLGDTIPKADVSIHSILFNKLAYQGNKFPIVAQIDHKGFEGKEAIVRVLQAGKMIGEERIILSDNGQLQEVQFLISASKSGYQRYTVVVTPIEGEFTQSNNRRSAFVEVVEGKETIALIAGSPHPDIKAIRSAIETNANYVFESYILSNSKDVERLKNNPKLFDLIIYHQLSNRRMINNAILNEVKSKDISSLYVYGSQNELREFNNDNGLVNVSITSDDYDEVTAAFNPTFESFKLSEELQSSFDQFPPVSVPFGNYTTTANSQILLFQRVGNITTSRPLLVLKSDQKFKNAVFMGSGLWRWKLTDFANHGNNKNFNELITKLVQYLTTKDDKRKFRAYPLENELNNTESLIFETEAYNDLYEPIYDKKIDIKLTNEEGRVLSYDFVTSRNNTQFEINGLPIGIYKYEVSTSMQSGIESIYGEIIVREMQLESQNLTADFELLRKISKQTGGKFYKEANQNELIADLSSLKPQGVIHSREQLKPFINLEWLLVLFLVLVSLEWFLRKYHGSY